MKSIKYYLWRYCYLFFKVKILNIFWFLLTRKDKYRLYGQLEDFQIEVEMALKECDEKVKGLR